MKRQWRLYLLTFGFALGSAANILADGPNLTTVEFPGAILTNAFGINNRGDIVGNFMNADQSDHGFLLSGANTARLMTPAPLYLGRRDQSARRHLSDDTPLTVRPVVIW
jgi:hypothetical protein